MITAFSVVLLATGLILQALSIRALNRRSAQLDKQIEIARTEIALMHARTDAVQSRINEFTLADFVSRQDRASHHDLQEELVPPVNNGPSPLESPVRDGFTALDTDIDD